MSRVAFGVLTVLALTAMPPPETRAQIRVYMTEEEAVERALGGAGDVRTRRVSINPALAERLSDELGAALLDSVYVFHEAWNGQLERSVVVVNAMGQYQPITFAVTIAALGTVESVDIMVYRESRGGEVRRRAFLEQFESRTSRDDLRVGRGVVGVSGATISSRGIADGVRLALRLHATLHELEDGGKVGNGN